MTHILSLAGLAALAMPAVALGQDREPFADSPQGPLLRPDVAGSRQPPNAGPLGVVAGPLRLLPSLRVQTVGDSKVTSTRTGRQGDTFVVFEPTLQVRHEGATMTAVARAAAGLARHARLSAQDRNAMGGSVELQWRFGPRTSITAKAGVARAYEPNFSVESADSAGSPARFNEARGEARVETEQGNARFALAASHVRRTYSPVVDSGGNRRDQSFRDSETSSVTVNGQLALRAGVTLLAQARQGWINSLNPDPCCDRSGDVSHAMVGLRGEVTPLLSFELLGGFQRRNFEANSFRDYSGPVWRTRLEWYATPLITVAATTGRELVSGGLRDAAGVEVDTSEIKVYYELRRNLSLIASAAHASERYRGTGITAATDSLGLEGSHLITERLSNGGFVRWRNRTSSSSRLDTVGAAIEGGMWVRIAM